LGLLGAGGHAREIAEYAGRPVSFCAVERAFVNDSSGLTDVEAPPPEFLEVEVVAAVGAPELRRRLVRLWAGTRYATVVASSAYVGVDNRLEPGVVVAPQAAITTGCAIGSHSHVNVAASISHDCVLGEFVTVGPGARVAGLCVLGSGVVLGPGASVVGGVTIADGVVVGAGSVVLNDVMEENAVVVGAPARRIRVGKEWLDEF
jgi:sugar O-acyltransferase (sialic acid O-acetyltransferase NeuD family)